MPKLDEDISRQVDFRMLRDIIKIVRQLNASGNDDGEDPVAVMDRKMKQIGKMAALAAVGAIKDPEIRLKAMPIIRGM